jgi:phage terminase large subunit-like protein
VNGVERCLQYVDDVLTGEIPAPLTVHQACERFIRDFDNEDLAFDQAAANFAVEEIETLRHAKGRWQGQYLQLENWQCFLVCNIFGWKWAATGLRRFRYVYEQVPRKNAKTTLAVAIALLMFGPDAEPGAECLLGATSMDQAKDLLFKPAKFIVETSDDFKDDYGIEINASNMVIPDNFSIFKTVIKKPDDGTSPHCAVVDEYHLHESTDMWSVFDTGMGAREQPLLLTTTTAGHTLGGPCHMYRDDMLKLLRGDYQDETTFALIFEPDPDDDWSDIETLRKVNPNINVSVSESFLVSQLHQARRSADKQNAYRTKHLNQWVGAKTTFMNMLAWQRQKCELTLDDFLGDPCHVAVDLAEQKDASSVAVMFCRAGKYYVFTEHFVPEAAFEWNDRYKTFSLAGQINVTEGNAQDYGEIRAHIDSLADRFTVQSIRFDPWQSAQMMQEIMDTGLKVYKQTQQFSDFSDAMKTVETAVLDRELYHPGDPVLTWMVGNTAALKNRDEHMKPVKDNPNNPRCKIDGCVAMIMCMKGWLDEETGGLDDFLNNPVAV